MAERALDASISEPMFHRVRDVAPNKVLLSGSAPSVFESCLGVNGCPHGPSHLVLGIVGLLLVLQAMYCLSFRLPEACFKDDSHSSSHPAEEKS